MKVEQRSLQKDGVSLPEDKLPVLKAKDGYTDAKWPEEATQPITADDTEFVSSATNWMISLKIQEKTFCRLPQSNLHRREGTSIESGTTVFAVKDGVSLPEDKLPVLKAKDGYTDAKWPEEATQPLQQMIQNLYQVQQNWMINLTLTNIILKVKK